MMRRVVLALSLAAALPALAGGIEAGIEHLIVMPTSETPTLDIATSRGFGAWGEYFWRDAVSVRMTASFVNPEAILRPDPPPPDDVDLGTLGLDTYALTVRAHFPSGSNWSGFAGGGGALVVPGNLDDQFGDSVEVEFDPQWTVVAEGGIRYRFRQHVVFELGATWMPLEAESKILKDSDPRFEVPSKVRVDPLAVTVGAGWRF